MSTWVGKGGHEVLTTSDPDKIVAADRLVLPGVGALKMNERFAVIVVLFDTQ